MIPAIEARHITFGYGRTRILHDLSFTVPPGECFVVIGPNGSGKTTLVKTVAGLLRAQGTLQIAGRPLERLSGRDRARHIAYVPQHLSADFPFTAGEVVAMGRSPHQGILGLAGKSDRDAVRRAMDATGVAHLENRRIGRLSGGERQRVHIARALCQEAQILLLDEPTASLDLAHQIQVMDLLARLGQTNALTVLMISHDINLAAMYAGRVLLMQQGRAVAAGTPREVLTPARLEAVYGCRVRVDESPLGDSPIITPVPGRHQGHAGGR